MAKGKTKKTANKKTKEMGKIYHKKTEVDGIVFDSQTEAEYYSYLKQLKADGLINKFTMQDEWILQEKYLIADGQRIDGSHPEFKKYQKKYPGCTVQPIKYISDFKVWHNNGTIQVIDVKGQKTVDFKIKEKLFNYKYPEYNKLYCVVKYNGKWTEYDEANKIKRERKKQKSK